LKLRRKFRLSFEAGRAKIYRSVASLSLLSVRVFACATTLFWVLSAATSAGENTLCFRAELAAGDYAGLRANQDAGDLVIEVRLPSGETVRRIDAFEYGNERASTVAASPGVYRFCVYPAEGVKKPAKYDVRFDGPRVARSEDKNRLDAETFATEARRLEQRSDGASLHLALDLENRSLVLWTELQDAEAQAATLIRAGDILNGLGDFPGAIGRYNDALALVPKGDFRAAAEALANSGVAKLRMGDISGASSAFDASLEILAKLRDPYLTAAVQNNRGNLFSQTGEFPLALDAYLSALPATHHAGNRPEGVLFGNIGLAYASIGDYVRAESWLQRSLPLLSDSQDRVTRAVALMNLGRIRALGGDLNKASPPLQQALTLVAGAAAPRARADILNNLGQVSYRKGEARAAIPWLAEAATTYRSIHDVRGLAGALHYSGAALAGLGEPETALASLREALELRQGARLDDDAIATLMEIARAERKLADGSAALGNLQRAITLVEKIRLNAASPDLRSTWFALRGRALYGELVDLLFDFQRPPEQTLEIAERARARSWIDEFGGKRYRALKAANPELANRETKLTRAINFKSQQLWRLPSGAEGAKKHGSLSREIEELELQYDALASEVAAKLPVKPESVSEPMTVAGIQGLLDQNMILLEYFLGEKRSYLWAITPQEVKCFSLPSRTELERISRPVADLAGLRRDRIAKPELEARYQARASQLSHILLGPAAGLIRGKDIVLSLDGTLNYVPFAALPSPDKEGVPLGIAHEVTEVPSASALGALRGRRQEAPKKPIRICLFADPVFTGDPRAPAPTGSQGRRGPDLLARLPFSLRESSYIQEAAKGADIVSRAGFAASKAALFQDLVHQPAILHFATHALVDTDRPDFSGIFLSQVDRTGAPRDGFLSLYEIYDLNLPAELVVLSGCSTGLGRAIAGDGFVGLARAFFYAGAPRVLASLWPVDDEGTALFMRAFYNSLLKRANPSPALALRDARESMWRDPRWKDPAYWSGFSLQGEPRPIRIRGANDD
jgi:CHAT domain-containing protein/Tfp pilus assembly protein PilF